MKAIEQWDAAYRRSIARLAKQESWAAAVNKAQLIFKAGWDAALALPGCPMVEPTCPMGQKAEREE